MKINRQNILLIPFGLLTIVPLAAGLIYALLSSFGLAGYLGNGFTLSYWHSVLSDGALLKTFGYSIWITTAVMVLSIASALAIAINYPRHVSQGISSYVMYIPLAIPMIVAAAVSWQILGNAGLIARVAYSVGMIDAPGDFPDLINDAWGIGIILTHWVIATVFFSILFTTIYKQQHLKNFSEAASTLGAENAYIRKRVVIPILIGKALPSIILYAIFIFGAYEVPMLIGRQDPQMISVAIAQKFTRYNLADVPIAYTLAGLYTITVIAILITLYFKGKLLHEVE